MNTNKTEDTAEKNQPAETSEKTTVTTPADKPQHDVDDALEMGEALGTGGPLQVGEFTIEAMNMEQIADVSAILHDMEEVLDIIVRFLAGNDLEEMKLQMEGKIPPLDLAADPANQKMGKMVIELVGKQGKKLYDLIAAGTSIDREAIGNMKPDTFLLVATSFIRVNLDFFVEKLMPALTEAMQGIGSTLGGMTPSNT